MRTIFGSTVSTGAAAALFSIMVGAASAHAAVGDLYAVTGSGDDGLECRGTLSSLYKIDPADAEASFIAPITIEGTQVRHVTGLAMHPQTGVLYAMMNDNEDDDGCNTSSLITVDTATGEATIVSTGAEPLPGNIPSIAFDPFGNLYAWTEWTDSALLIDIGSATWEFLPNGAQLSSFSTGIASDSKGRLYVKVDADLYRLNQYTGDVFDLVVIDRQAHNVLAFDAADVMYSGRRSSGFTLFTVDPETGATVVKGSNSVEQISALAFDRGVVTPPVVADLALEKSVDENKPLIGTDVVFTLKLSHLSAGGDAENVVVRDVLPDNFSFVSATGDGSYNDATGEWTIASVPQNSSVEIEITATAVSAGSWTNKAEVVASDSYDPDSVPGSGDTSGDTYFEVSGSVTLPTLFSIDRDLPYLWVIDPTLVETDAAQELSFPGHSFCGSNGLATDPGTNTLFAVLDDCSGRRLVTIDEATADVTDVGSFGNVRIAAIAFGDDGTLYATSGNNGADTRTLFTVDPTDGSLTARCLLPESSFGRALAFGDNLIFHGTMHCTGACELVISSIDPAAFPTNASDPCPMTSFETGLGEEPTGMTVLEVGADDVTFLVSAFSSLYQVTIPGESSDADWTFLDFLSHSSKGLSFANAGVTVSNLTVSKSTAKSKVKGKRFIEYLLQAQNNGPDDASGVFLTDEIPFGTTLVSIGSGCSEAGGVVTCEAGDLAANQTEFFSMIVEVTCKKCKSISNTVTIGSDADLFENPFDNQWHVETSIKGKF